MTGGDAINMNQPEPEQPEDFADLAREVVDGPMMPPGGWADEDARTMLEAAVLTMLESGYSLQTIGELCSLIMQSVFKHCAARDAKKIMVVNPWGLN